MISRNRYINTAGIHNAINFTNRKGSLENAIIKG